ncbi:MAG: CopG family antitoxin [Bdellovibrionales bacterium]
MKQPRLNDVKVDTEGTKAMRKMMAKAKKIKITINVDEDLLIELRHMAQETDTPYQSLLNRVLKDAVMSKKDEGGGLGLIDLNVKLSD